MPATPPETQAREAMIALLGTEFAPEQFPVRDDKLHASLGSKATTLGVYCARTISSPRDRYVSEIEVVVQFYARYDLRVDPEQTVSPKPIEAFAERFRQALQAGSSDPNTGSVWYFTLERIDYPDDPTGNKTRFEAYLRARGNNTALVETTG